MPVSGNGYDAVTFFTNLFTKIVHFALVSLTYSADQVAVQFALSVVQLHG